MSPEEDEYSDSDEETLDEIETSVLLGLPDGVISSTSDLVDPAVSRIGGTPAFLPGISRPPYEISHCKVCSNPMELLVEMWCPFEASPMDRILYVWGCGRSGCQKKDGSIRAYRCVKFNEKFAAKLARKQEKEKEKERLKQEASKPAPSKPSSNPFSMSGTSEGMPSMGLFGGNMFESTAQDTSAPDVSNKEIESDDDEPPATSDDIAALTLAFESTSITPSSDLALWTSSPAYQPLYLSTVNEYIPAEPSPETKAALTTSVGSGTAGGWTAEAYESSKLDEVFDKFSKIVANEGSQCIRYELSGMPLAYQTDAIYKRLFPLNSSTPLGKMTSGATFVSSSAATIPKRSYDPSTIPACPICKGPRTFECQLAPNLINVLKPPTVKGKKRQTETERRNELARVLLKKDVGGAPAGGTTADEKIGMEWGTCMVFSCLSDCSQSEEGEQKDLKECWREEVVLVQWEE